MNVTSRIINLLICIENGIEKLNGTEKNIVQYEPNLIVCIINRKD